MTDILACAGFEPTDDLTLDYFMLGGQPMVPLFGFDSLDVVADAMQAELIAADELATAARDVLARCEDWMRTMGHGEYVDRLRKALDARPNQQPRGRTDSDGHR